MDEQMASALRQVGWFGFLPAFAPVYPTGAFFSTKSAWNGPPIGRWRLAHRRYIACQRRA
jgi:hypothetical protein